MEEKIIEIIAKVLHVPASEITADTEIGEPDEWDSLHNLTIFSELEKTFNVKITQDMVMDLEDVSDIVNLLEELTK
jgi:acyl carrier protein|nr:acyl carrier protein [uncultured Prevotella sp.]